MTHERRWAAAYTHRERLLRIARARVDNPHDAEDCVQEALVRCVEFAGLDEERLGQFLTTVTIRLCADVHRGQTRGAKLSRRLTSFVTDDPGPEESVCDRAESAWLSRRLDSLTPRQRAIVEARAEGLSCGAVAERLLLPYSTVESALARIRRGMRGALESTLGVAPSWPNLRRLVAGGLATTAAAVTIAGVVGGPADARRPVTSPHTAQAGDRAEPAVARSATVLTTAVSTTAALAVRMPAVQSTVALPHLHGDPVPPGLRTYLGGYQQGIVETGETWDQTLERCRKYGWAFGDDRVGCRFPPGDPRNDQHETVGIPPAPEGVNQ